MQLDKQPDIEARWFLYIGQVTYEIKLIPDLQNPADYLSRIIPAV